METPLSRNSVWRFHCSIDPVAPAGHVGRRRWPAIVAACAVVVAGAGCGGGEEEVCGPGEAPAAGVTATIGDDSVMYGSFTSSPNNDCPPSPDAPISLTLDGSQFLNAGFLTFCLPRPTELGDSPVSLTDSDHFQVIDVRAELDNACRVFQDESSAPSGTVQFLGYCDGGLDPAGYAIEFSGAVPGVRQCPDGAGGTTEESITITLSGQASVRAMNL